VSRLESGGKTGEKENKGSDRDYTGTELLLIPGSPQFSRWTIELDLRQI